MSAPPSLEAFIAAYGCALGAGDLEAIADCWGIPSIVLSDQGALAVTERSQVTAFFAQAVAGYHEQGLVAAVPDIHRANPLTERLWDVEVRWSARDAGGVERSVENSLYVLEHGEGDRWCIRVTLSRPPE